MKRLSIISIITAAFAFGFASCADNAEEFKKGAPDAANCYGVYFPAQKTELLLDPSEPTFDTILVARTKTEGAITVPFVLKDDSKIFEASELKFEDGQTESFIVLTFDSAQVGTTYTCSIVIEDVNYASQYTSNAIAIDISVMRDKWNSLGLATYTDYWFTDEPFKVELLQNDKDKNSYRLVDPYHPIDSVMAAAGYTITTPSSIFPFKVLKKGETYADQKITLSGLISYPIVNTGWNHPSYKADVLLVHPCNFKDYATEDTWVYNKVIQYQENGLPAGVQIAPFYYMNGVGGWSYADADPIPGDGGIVFVYPGAVLTDYSLTIKPDFADDGKQDVAFILGTDVAFAEFSTFEGELTAAKIDEKVDAIIAGEDSTALAIDSTCVVTLSFPATGKYTLVAVAYDEDSVPQTAESVILNYVAAKDSVPVDLYAELICTKKYERSDSLSSDNCLEYTIYGSNLTSVSVALFPSTKFLSKTKECIDLMKNDEEGKYAVKASVLEQINESGYTDVFKKLIPGLSYTLVVIGTNGYEEEIAVSSATTTGIPLPIYLEYDMSDIDEDLCPDSAKAFNGKYDFFASSGSSREKVSTVVMKAVNDSIISVKGMFSKLAQKYGFKDSVNFFFEDGVLYTLATVMDSVGDGYYAALNVTNGKSYWSYENSGALIGGFVDKNHIAFVDNETGVGINGWLLSFYEDAECKELAGHVAMYLDLMFAKPGLYDGLFAPVRTQSLASKLSSVLKAPRTNYVETSRGYIKSKIRSIKDSEKIASCGVNAGFAIVPEPRSVAAKVVAVKAYNKSERSLEASDTVFRF